MIIVAAASRVGQRIIGGVDLLKFFGSSRAFRRAGGNAVRVGFQSLSCLLSIHILASHGGRVTQTSCMHLESVVEMQWWLSQGRNLEPVSEMHEWRVRV